MRELGVEIGDRVPHRLEGADAEWADVVVTMGCGDACPVLPGKRYVDWELDDPARPGRSSGCARSATRSRGASRPSSASSTVNRPGKRAPPDGGRGATAARRGAPGDEAAVLRQALDARPLPAALDRAGDGRRARPRLADPEPERRPRQAARRHRLAADRARAAADDVPGAREGALRGARPQQAHDGVSDRALLRRLALPLVGRRAAAHVRARLAVPRRPARLPHRRDHRRPRPLHRDGADLERPRARATATAPRCSSSSTRSSRSPPTRCSATST